MLKKLSYVTKVDYPKFVNKKRTIFIIFLYNKKDQNKSQ